MLQAAQRLLLGVCLIGTLLLSAGCGGKSVLESEKKDKHFQRAQFYSKQSKHQEALTLYLKLIDEYEFAPESHLEAGRIYLKSIKDPVSAIYHFRRYLEISGASQQAPLVKELISTAKKEFARTLPGNMYDPDSQLDRVDLMDALQKERDENLKLKRKLKIAAKKLKEAGLVPEHMATAQAEVKESPYKKEKTTFAPKPTVTRPQLYTVESGDTLSQISQKVYGGGSHWERIFKANKESLKSPTDLRVGQILKVPPLPEEA